jgi:hypothetical protein
MLRFPQSGTPMTDAIAPITQDVLTIPRKLPEGGRTNIVGLTRDQLRDALIAAGTPEKQPPRCGWARSGNGSITGACAISRDDQPRQGLSRAAGRHFVIALPRS